MFDVRVGEDGVLYLSGRLDASQAEALGMVNQIVPRDNISHRRVDEIVENLLPALFGSHLYEERHRIDDLPPRPDIDVDPLFVAGLHALRGTVPRQGTLLQIVCFLNKRQFNVQSGLGMRSLRIS